MRKLLFPAIVGFLMGCSSTTPLNEIPMYNNIYNNDEVPEWIKTADSKFISEAIAASGSRESACIDHVKYGWNYFYQGNYKTAIKRFNQAWLLDSTESDVYFGFAAYMKLINNDNESNKYYTMAKLYDKENAGLRKYHKSIIMLWDSKKEYDSIIKFLKQYELQNPLFADSYATIGYYFMESGKFDSSATYLNKSIDLNPSDSISMLNLGWQNHIQNKHLVAIKFFNKAIAIAPKYVNAYVNRASCFNEMGEFDKAVKDCESAISIVAYSESGQLYRLMGVNKISAGRKADGCADLKKALEIGDTYLDKSVLLKYIDDNCGK